MYTSDNRKNTGSESSMSETGKTPLITYDILCKSDGSDLKKDDVCSDIPGRTALRNCTGNLSAAAFLAFFGAVYEYFSHDVYSYFMIYAFAVPLLAGAIPFAAAALKGYDPDRIFINLWNSAIAAFSVGSLFKGVLDIYGTTNRLTAVYPVTGTVLALAAVIHLIRKR